MSEILYYCPECRTLRPKSGFGYVDVTRHRRACADCLARIKAMRAHRARNDKEATP